MSTTESPTMTTLSHLMRLGAEQDLTDEKLNALYTTGILACVFRADPKQVNIAALERVLGLKQPLVEKVRALLIDHRLAIGALLKQHNVVADDNLHMNVPFPCEARSEAVGSVFTSIRNPNWGKVIKAESGRGVRSANLRELITLASYRSEIFEGRPVFALGSKTGGLSPEVFYLQEENGVMHLKHTSSYGSFPPNVLFLGILIEGLPQKY